MNTGKALRLLVIGFVIAILAIGMLPFLVVYSWSDLYGITEMEPASTPLSVLLKLLKQQ
ncbi:hypothetical protein [Paenibacillus montanisoli]|uniref:hypothetical protein n=1 Tax=Paenibacillus montanisoli TaxID=2081970 RepID=UPI00140243DF|nr:hypothetical protein [Paenibacillus montanisoli]